MATHKCSFTFYLGNVPILITNKALQLKMFSEIIPIDHSPKYLGINLDRHVNFNRHTEILRIRSLNNLTYSNASLTKNGR